METGTGLFAIDVQFHVKYDLPQLLNKFLGDNYIFLSISSCWSARKIKKFLTNMITSGRRSQQKSIPRQLQQLHIENTLLRSFTSSIYQ